METLKTIAAIATMFVGIPVVIMTLIDRLTTAKYKPPTDEELAKMKTDLLDPDWAAMESHFGSPPLDSLKKLYQDQQLLVREEFELPWPSAGESYYIAAFLPMRQSTLSDYDAPLGQLPIATDGSGGTYFFHWTEDHVSFRGHDDDVPEKLASLAIFLG